VGAAKRAGLSNPVEPGAATWSTELPRLTRASVCQGQSILPGNGLKFLKTNHAIGIYVLYLYVTVTSNFKSEFINTDGENNT
jgi:hypothetical protein